MVSKADWNLGEMIKCPYCGVDNPAGENFCNSCGYALDSSTTPATSTNTIDTILPVAAATRDTPTASSTNTVSRLLAPNVQLQEGRYVVEKMLGQGGMGAAVLARDTRVSNKKVVIKELASDESDPQQRQEDVRNFKREVETLAHLDHPLIPTVTDSFQEGSRYYMVQEYAAGENLEDDMERLNKPMPEHEALTYVSQVLDILAYLGQQQPPTVHRDIKPANIIVSAKDKRARLVDFGIARTEVTKNTRRKQTSALGTPGYAPPEQYQGNADARSDLYALAATLHHLLTSRDPRDYPPFNYPLVRTLNPKISPETERVLERALTLDITKRYQSAAAMKHDIDEILLQRYQDSGEASSSYTYSPGLAPLPTKPRTYSSSTRTPDHGPTPINQGSRSPYEHDAYGPDSAYSAQSSRDYGQQQQLSRMYMPPPAPVPPRQRLMDGSNYLVQSFVMLLVVIFIIAAILFFLPH